MSVFFCGVCFMTNEKLCIAIQSGTGDKQQLLEQLYLQNVGMIEKIIRRYGGAEELEDLRQESYFGIVKAAELWKPEKGASFLTYAAFWIRSTISRYMEECGGVVRIPSYKRALIGRYYRTLNSYRVRFGCDPSNRELYAALDITKDQLKELKKDIQAARIRSTSEPIGGESEELTLEDTLAAAGDPIGEALERMQHKQLSAELWSCVDDLEPRESAVIRSRYGNEQALTLKECGENLGVSPERVRQVEAAALRKLRKPRYTKRILPYLDDKTAYSWGMRGTGHGVFERAGSVQERAMMRLEEIIAGTNLYYGIKSPVFYNFDTDRKELNENNIQTQGGKHRQTDRAL